jgi:hypothetical protein
MLVTAPSRVYSAHTILPMFEALATMESSSPPRRRRRPPHHGTAFSPVKNDVRTYPTTSIQISVQAPLKPSRIHETLTHDHATIWIRAKVAAVASKARKR